MSAKDTTLDFHDSGQDDVLFQQGNMQTHTFTNFPNSAEDEDEEDKSEDFIYLEPCSMEGLEFAEESLKEVHVLSEMSEVFMEPGLISFCLIFCGSIRLFELLKEDKKQLSFWTFEYYQQFFDVETTQVFHRVAGSMLPLPHRNFLQTHIRPTPDLYGPFWICTTLVFTTAIAGNLANYLASGGKDYQWKYDFHKVTFSATAIFCYWWLIPTAVYLLLWWRRSSAGYTFLEIICVYGYSLAIYIPISILWVVNYEWFKWTLVMVGAVLSGGVLVLTFWPAVKEDTKRVAIIAIALIFICHLALACGFVLYFFHVPARTDVTMTTTVAPVPAELPKDVPKAERLAGPASEVKKAPLDTVKNKDQETDNKETTNRQKDKTVPQPKPQSSDKKKDQRSENTETEKVKEDKSDIKPAETNIPKDKREDIKQRVAKLRDRLSKMGSRTV